MHNVPSLLLSLTETDSRFYFIFDVPSNKFIFLNKAFKSFFNTTLEKVTVNALLVDVAKQDLSYLKQVYSRRSKNTHCENVDFRIKLPKGHVWLRLNGFFSDSDGSNLITGYMEDITALKAHDDKLNEYSNKKNAVLSILAHDLAGPIGSIQMLAGVIAKTSKDFPDQTIYKFINQIKKVSTESTKMISDFISVEFLESAKVNVVIKRTNLTKCLQSLIQGYQKTEISRQLTFILIVETDIYAEIDEAKFIQAINNLISNAIKFTYSGGTISISLEEAEDHLLLTVKDTGVGIPKEFQSSLFEKFNPARRQGLKGESSVGLGMSVIHTIIEWHKGQIWFESKENIGTTFFIKLKRG
jgi:two-component system sensor histidine kinase VicK